MKLHWIGKLYGCFLYETIIQIALWFIVTFITLVFLGDNHSINPSILGFILWCSSGLYFIYSWANGGQTLSMRAWKLKLIPPQHHKPYFYIYRYIFASLGLFLFLSFYLYIIFRGRQYVHDLILKSKIICTQTC